MAEKSRETKNAPRETPPEELAVILAAQKIEAGWWKNTPAIRSAADIAEAVRTKRAVNIFSRRGFKISEKVPEEFRVLEKETAALLVEIADTWTNELEKSGIDISRENLFLVITSLGRTAEYQEQLIAAGFPAAPESAHTKLTAFDITHKWLEENQPVIAGILENLLERLSGDGRINLIKEKTMGVYHIARNPNFKSEKK